MGDPTFLTLDDVLAMHEYQISTYGGPDGICSLDLLISALQMPMSGTVEGFFHVDLFEMAAAYLFHISENQPFVDGNKRTGVDAALTFLGMNDVDIDVDPLLLFDVFAAAIEQQVSKATLASSLRDWAGARKPV